MIPFLMSALLTRWTAMNGSSIQLGLVIDIPRTSSLHGSCWFYTDPDRPLRMSVNASARGPARLW